VLELALRQGDRTLLLRLIEYDDKLAPIFYIPAVLLVLAAGIGLVLDGPWGFGDGWVVAGIILLVGAFVVGVGFVLPVSKRLHTAVADSGPESAATGAALARFRTLTWIDAAVLVAAVFVMTAKPF
jgi:uncharacterized membrane protein